MTRLLALDTSTEACSVALWADGAVVEEIYEIAERSHTQRLLPMIETVLNDAGLQLGDLDGLVCTRGPGSFTGIRVGVSAAQGLAFAAELPVLPLSTLAVLAWQGVQAEHGKERWQVVMDARMGEIYYAAYAWLNGKLTVLADEQLLAPAELDVWADHTVGRIGAGWQLPILAEHSSLVALSLPRAATAAAFAAHLLQQDGAALWQPPDALQPVYLRDQVTHGR
ncbi:tRNA (adenosine(37)-N6)-threonylcarbamoyltransferase complex dimerization subunit type 1 TsaB [Salinispirillum sp. LH 10-3-1]|uniref:tRNA threonylcarbamoyladenosine biosynthesis protein TsaB n=1 Tax=Salinispirillum sp. LH 10-3-1 TaxID=2952525 RepID=A0AB38YJX9_9GAMM